MTTEIDLHKILSLKEKKDKKRNEPAQQIPFGKRRSSPQKKGQG
jgi:hypothetical protein